MTEVTVKNVGEWPPNRSFTIYDLDGSSLGEAFTFREGQNLHMTWLKTHHPKLYAAYAGVCTSMSGLGQMMFYTEMLSSDELKLLGITK